MTTTGNALNDWDLDIVAGGRIICTQVTGSLMGAHNPFMWTCIDAPTWGEVLGGIVKNLNNILYGPKGK